MIIMQIGGRTFVLICTVRVTMRQRVACVHVSVALDVLLFKQYTYAFRGHCLREQFTPCLTFFCTIHGALKQTRIHSLVLWM